MTQTAKWFGLALKDQFGATAGERFDWVGDTFKLALVKATTTLDQDADRYWSTHQPNEASGTGYTVGGFTLAGKSLSYDAATKTVRFKCNDITIAALTATNVRYPMIYKDTGVAATSPLVGYVDLGAGVSPAAAPFNLFWDATDGVLRLRLPL